MNDQKNNQNNISQKNSSGKSLDIKDLTGTNYRITRDWYIRKPYKKYVIKEDNINIQDKWETQQVQYRNSLIDKPLIFGSVGGGMGMGMGMALGASSWSDAVEKMARWYEVNIHNYSQGRAQDPTPTWTFCPLINQKVRHDCSGYVTSCMKLYGIPWTHNTMASVRAETFNQSDSELIKSYGFTYYNSPSLAATKAYVQPWDIMVGVGHTEIYAGNNKSWTWGKCHDLAHGGMPSGTAWMYYSSIYRFNGQVTATLTPPGGSVK